jgi:hypothetical protein
VAADRMLKLTFVPDDAAIELGWASLGKSILITRFQNVSCDPMGRRADESDDGGGIVLTSVIVVNTCASLHGNVAAVLVQ